jgi:hypothetical protein
MVMRWHALILSVMLLCSNAWALEAPKVNLEGRVELTPDKKHMQLLPMKLETDLTPQTAVNDPVQARLIMPVSLGQAELPVDSRLKGYVTEHKPGERFGRRTRLNIKWTAWCPAGQDCQAIPETAPVSRFPAKITGTSGSSFKRFVPLQILSYGISIPLGLTAMPFWSTMFIEQGVGAVAGATYETLKPEDESETKSKRLVMGALNSTSLPTITRFVKKAPDINVPANTALWMPVDNQMLGWMMQQDKPTDTVTQP